jgi:alpha-ketoglutarate-dependent 2,4-dichlorophenoxyacetate dioxygenase
LSCGPIRWRTENAVIPIGNDFVAEVIGVDLRAPIDADTAAAIHAAMDRYAVLVFHDHG